jgi:hypothetical protein
MDVTGGADTSGGWLKTVLVGAVVLVCVYLAGRYFGWWGASGTNTVGGVFDGSGNASVATPTMTTPQGQYGISFWMYVQDWAYRYGQEKSMLTRSDASGNMNPQVLLHATDNCLIIRISYLPANSADGAHETFECEVPHIPLQAWTALSISMSQKNVDVYLNGMLVKSCFIPGAPINLVSDAKVGSDGGFQGKLSDLTVSPTSLSPADAQAYYQKGSSAPGSSVNSTNPFTRYTYKFSMVDPNTQSEIQSYTL